MKPGSSLRERIRSMLADLKMPGALEAVDTILSGVDGGTLTGAEAIEALLSAQIELRNNRCHPRLYRRQNHRLRI